MRGAIDFSDGGVMQQIKPQRLLMCVQLLVMVAIAPPTQPIKAEPAFPAGHGYVRMEAFELTSSFPEP